MLWTKVSNKYAELFFSDSSDSVFRTYIRLMLLVSSMEVEPNLNQISFKLGKRKVQSLLDYIEKKQEELGKDEISLDIIVQKVMEDVDAVKQKRDGGKARQKKHRVTHNVTHTDKNKIRTREDKTITKGVFDSLWKLYPNNDGKKDALRHFNASVLTKQDIVDIKKALDNYLEHVKTKAPKYIKNGSTWFNNWKDWIEYIPNNDKESSYDKSQRIYKEVMEGKR